MKPISYFAHGRNVEISVAYTHLVMMKTRKEIAAEYGIPVWMLHRRIKQHKIKLSRQRMLPIEDVVEIYIALHWPLSMYRPNNGSHF